MIPFYCLKEMEQLVIQTDFDKPIQVKGSYVRKGDKIAQFRIQEKMPRKNISIVEVESLSDESRGGFGSTGDK